MCLPVPLRKNSDHLHCISRDQRNNFWEYIEAAMDFYTIDGYLRNNRASIKFIRDQCVNSVPNIVFYKLNTVDTSVIKLFHSFKPENVPSQVSHLSME